MKNESSFPGRRRFLTAAVLGLVSGPVSAADKVAGKPEISQLRQ